MPVAVLRVEVGRAQERVRLSVLGPRVRSLLSRGLVPFQERDLLSVHRDSAVRDEAVHEERHVAPTAVAVLDPVAVAVAAA